MLDIIYEDKDIIVVRKPAGQESQGGKSFSMDLLSELKNYLARKQNNMNPYVAVVHRLDRPVSGVMVYAKTQLAAACLSKQIQNGQMKKRYYALLSCPIVPESGTLEHYLGHDKKRNQSFVAAKGEAGAKLARLNYHTVPLDTFDEWKDMQKITPGWNLSLVDIELLTGRHHQIRVQFAAMGCPLLGDKKYSNIQQPNMSNRIGLCAYQLEFWHPTTKKKMMCCYVS